MAAALDIEDAGALIGYLRRTGRIGAGERPEVVTLPGGVSNRTVLLRRPDGERWVLKQALAKLRVAADWYSSPERVHREAAGLRWLARLTPEGATPRLLFEDFDHHLLAMEAVAEPHHNWKALLLREGPHPDHVARFGALLGTIHANAYRRREEVAPAFDDRSFFESLRLDPYYRTSAERAPAAAAFLEALIGDTRRQRLTLVHGDYSPKNVLVHRDTLTLIDHEVIHWGDPAFDLGFALTHLLAKANHLPPLRDAFLSAARTFWASYRASLGDPPWAAALPPRAARHTLACLLARVEGRSPLEYLSADQRALQRRLAVDLMADPPPDPDALVGALAGGLDARP